MAYVALYRKYRPKKFEDVVGQNVIITILKNCIKNNKIGHAYIFSGTRGTGKTSVAKIFSRAVNCLSPSVDGDLCLKCEACKNTENNNIDIIEIDAASNNGVDEIREIRNNVTIMPSFVKYKVYIIDEVHMLSGSAFNALLKTLEEPPEHVIFILATTELNKIPSTVLSRCQKLDFKKISPGLIEKQLKNIISKEKVELNDEVIKLVATLSDGSFRDAINLIDQIIAYEKSSITTADVYDLIGGISNELAFELLDSIFNYDIKNGLKIINKLYDSGKNFYKISDRIQSIVRDIIVYNNTRDYFDKKYEQELDKYANVDNNLMFEVTNLLFALNNSIKKSNDQKVLFETYYIRLALLFSKNSEEHEKPVQDHDDIQDVLANKSQEVSKTTNSTKKDENLNDDTHVDIEIGISSKITRINNTLAEADKSKKVSFIESYHKINDYITNNEYNAVSNLLLKCIPQVVSERNVLFVFKNAFEVVLFDKNIDKIQKLIKSIYAKKYNLVAVDAKDWKSIEDKFKIDRKNGIVYKYTDETTISKKSKKSSALEKEAENIFGDGLISIE